MTVRRIIVTGLCCLAFACGKTMAPGGNLNDPCVRNADCNTPFICYDAGKGPACSLDLHAACLKDKQRCNGLDIETCEGSAGDADHGNKWVVKDATRDHCTTGCVFDATAQ